MSRTPQIEDPVGNLRGHFWNLNFSFLLGLFPTLFEIWRQSREPIVDPDIAW